tara:strand:+ start:2209 stop:2763 length:555 start_codon:yes stop_codon:yes gene_type:complete
MSYTKEHVNNFHKRGYYNYLCSKEFSPVYKYVSQEIISSGAKTVLDIGCWNGMFCKELVGGGYAGEYLGFDLSDKAIAEAKRTFSDQNIQFVSRSWEDPPLSNRFDAIYVGGVLYYIKDKASFLNNLIGSYEPSLIVVQDLVATDCSIIEEIYDSVKTKYFTLDLNAHKDPKRNKRQVKSILIR